MIGQPIVPDVDMGSSNGTYLNRNRQLPYVETSVAKEDVVYLGKLNMQVLVD